MNRLVTMCMILGLISGVAAPAEAEQGSERAERTVEASYYGAQLLYDFRSCAVSGGAGCIALSTLAHEDSLTAKVTDAHGQPVSVWVVDASQRLDASDGIDEVYGTFCGETTHPILFDPGAELELWIGGDWWPRWWVLPDLDCVPGAGTTGTLSVTLSGWSSSEAASTSPGPSDPPVPSPSPSREPVDVERTVELVLRRHLRAAGSVLAEDGSCSAEVPVVIQRKTPDRWLDVASTTTGGEGEFSIRLADRRGRYRVAAPEFTAGEVTCAEALSSTASHRH